MNISVILSTYNGENYIIDQLESVRNQTQKVNEVLIRDDGSTDSTVKLITEYINENRLNNWILSTNQENQGWKKNFYTLLLEANGDIIFLCDQDDVWHLDKIEKMSNIMLGDSSILVLASNYTPFYEGNGVVINMSQEELENTGRVYSPKFKDFFYIHRPGCVYAVNRDIIPYFKEVHVDDDAHDALLWRLAGLMGGLRIYATSTINFRRHDNNATGSKVSTYLEWKSNISYYEDVLYRLSTFIRDNNVYLNSRNFKRLKRYKSWAKYRNYLFQKNNFLYWIILLRYIQYYFSPKTYLKDLVIFIKGKLKWEEN